MIVIHVIATMLFWEHTRYIYQRTKLHPKKGIYSVRQEQSNVGTHTVLLGEYIVQCKLAGLTDLFQIL